ncbi:mechanosensitive ion channel family protein [Nanoarchaeota archaeon]
MAYQEFMNMIMQNGFMQNEYIRATVILLFIIILAKSVHIILKVYVSRLAKKTKTDIDDIILEETSMPIYKLILLLGIYFAFRSLSLLSPYIRWFNMAFFILFVLSVTSIISKVFRVIVPKWLKVKRKYEKTPKLISMFLNILLYIIAALIILDHFNVEITPMIATLGLGGLAVGLALQNTLSNFFAGIHLLTDKPIRVGDFVELEKASITGNIEDIGWRSTRIKTLGNNIVVIPNSKLAESVITNVSKPDQNMTLMIECGVSYESNLDKVEKVTVDVAKKVQNTVEGAVKDHTPTMRFIKFGDSNINFNVFLRIESRLVKFPVRHEFIKALKSEFDKKGIEISWPVRKIVNT